MNKKMGFYSSIITFIFVLSFLSCMILGMLLNNDNIGKYGSYFSSIFIALGFIAMICSYYVFINKEYNVFGLISIAFSIMYGAFVIVVYFIQLTTVRLSDLSGEILELIDYSKFGLFFNLNLLGYGFMALSTFFIGIKLETKNKEEKILKYLLCIHGIFFISCLITPLLGIFNKNTADGDVFGIIALLFWCIYFMPICILSYRYFEKK
jgi:uncharacterized membrane-anchored protein